MKQSYPFSRAAPKELGNRACQLKGQSVIPVWLNLIYQWLVGILKRHLTM